MTVGDIASLIIALGTIGSLIYISRQVNVARKQAKGQFLLALDGQFEKFNDITKTQYVIGYWTASIYAALGDKDKAFAELEDSYVEHDFYMHRLKVDPFWDPLRDDPRYKDLLKRLNLPE